MRTVCCAHNTYPTKQILIYISVFPYHFSKDSYNAVYHFHLFQVRFWSETNYRNFQIIPEEQIQK